MVTMWLVPASAFAQDPAPAAPAAPAGPPSSDEVVRAVLSARCGNCHGPELADPEGKFGFVTDLTAMIGKPLHAGDLALVQPGDPDKSLMWDLIVHGDMPPDDSPQMTAAEQTIVKEWILGLTASANANINAATPGAPAEKSMGPVEFAGRFHVLVLHFPVALLLVALLAELMALRRASVRADAEAGARWLNVARFCTWTGALGGVAAAVTGWASYLSESLVRAEFLEWHKIGGTVVAVLAIGTALLAEWAVRSNTPRARWILRGALVLVAALITLTAHFGGIVVHGVNHVPLPF